MDSSDEIGIDQEVEAAWLTLRIRLADQLAALEEDGSVELVGEPLHGLVPYVEITVLEGELVVFVNVNRLDGTPTDDRQPLSRRLKAVGLGFDTIIARDDVDLAAHRVTRALREVFGYVSPEFIENAADLGLLDAPAAEAGGEPDLPESVVARGREALVEWVDRTMERRLGHTPRKQPDGTIALRRDHGRVVVAVGEKMPVIEVSAVVARDVDVRRARRVVASLDDRYHFFRFSVVDDVVLVATTVNALPFAPAHLDRAIDSTFTFLAEEAEELRHRLEPDEPDEPDEPGDAETGPAAVQARAEVDDALVMLFSASADPRTVAPLARELARDDRGVLVDWRDRAFAAAAAAKDKAALASGPVQNVLIEAVVAWRMVGDALDDALRGQAAA